MRSFVYIFYIWPLSVYGGMNIEENLDCGMSVVSRFKCVQCTHTAEFALMTWGAGHNTVLYVFV